MAKLPGYLVLTPGPARQLSSGRWELPVSVRVRRWHPAWWALYARRVWEALRIVRVIRA